MEGIISIKEIGGLLLSKDLELKEIYIFGPQFRNNHKNFTYTYENATYSITEPILLSTEVGMLLAEFRVNLNWPENSPDLEDLSHLFEDCFGLEKVVMFKWPSNVKNISYMFRNCPSLKSVIGLERLDTTNVIDMSGVFENCHGLRNLDLHWSTINVKDMKYLFSNCQSLVKVEGLPNWNTKLVRDMSFMFNECPLLNPIPKISTWNTENVVKITRMFFRCGINTISVYLENL